VTVTASYHAFLENSYH